MGCFMKIIVENIEKRKKFNFKNINYYINKHYIKFYLF